MIASFIKSLSKPKMNLEDLQEQEKLVPCDHTIVINESLIHRLVLNKETGEFTDKSLLKQEVVITSPDGTSKSYPFDSMNDGYVIDDRFRIYPFDNLTLISEIREFPRRYHLFIKAE